MTKKITNPIATIVSDVNGAHHCRADYGVIAEGVKEKRSIEFALKLETVSDIHDETLEAIHAEEGTTEVVDGEE